MKVLRRLFLFSALTIVSLLALVLWMAGGVQGPRPMSGQIQTLPETPHQAANHSDPRVVRVVSWNIAWAYGWGSEGSGEAKPAPHFGRNLDAMGRVLASLKPDFVLLQEVDFDSARSHGTQQAVRLAQQCGLRHVATFESWRANYVPFPYWPPSNHFGRVRSGGAILSRFPLQTNEGELLPKPTKNPWWYNLFYLFRYVHHVEAQHPLGPITLANAHLEAFDAANRLNQASRAREILDALGSNALIFGGDMNSVPPESPTKHDYPDEPQTDHRSDETVEVLRSTKAVDDTLPPQTMTATPSAWFTFPAHAPNRKLDYIFASDRFEVVSTKVVSEINDASDHLPVVVELRFKSTPES
ncbi:MAG: endonuclease/exonuclease/phosphatase family protein [Myxococcota bacterium]